MMRFMKKFVLIFHGHETPTPRLEAARNTWFQRRAASFADVGSLFGPGRRITNEKTIELSLASNPASGYSVLQLVGIALECLVGLSGLPQRRSQKPRYEIRQICRVQN